MSPVHVHLCYSKSTTIGGDGYGGRCAGLMDIDEDYIIECHVEDQGPKEAPGVTPLRWSYDTGAAPSWSRFTGEGPDEDDVIEKLEQAAWDDVGGQSLEHHDVWSWEAAFAKWAEANAPEGAR